MPSKKLVRRWAISLDDCTRKDQQKNKHNQTMSKRKECALVTKTKNGKLGFCD